MFRKARCGAGDCLAGEAIGQVVKPSKSIRERLDALGEVDTRPAICIALEWATKYLDAQVKASA